MQSGFSLNAMDPRALSDIERLSRENGNSPEALRSAAEQFEALFMQMVFKAMREATPQDGLFDNEQTRMFQQLHDQQVAMNMSQEGKGVGLADALYRQLGGERAEQRSDPIAKIGPDGRHYFDLANVPRRPATAAVLQQGGAADAGAQSSEGAAPLGNGALAAARPKSAGEENAATGTVSGRVQSFVDKVWDHAEKASAQLQVPPHFLVAQAALESGWGQAELRTAEGAPSHNLFNIKAGRSWEGATVELPVTEYANGRPYTEVSRFRAYDSYDEAFDDYVRLIANGERYADLIGRTDASDFAKGLQKSGYATDPLYADKLERIIGGRTLRDAIQGSERLLTAAR